ncbi:hypothetical protein B0H16DRAFT_516609 [Mycena metata]|uniref:Uncharacterized protein n=1 Tax=Mycena metata TaxID=1033252 RepID=A0AAD7JE59_9AGAR|nr:hypothetical protein B0H16DRAFT_516609 [Mycena metata]
MRRAHGLFGFLFYRNRQDIGSRSRPLSPRCLMLPPELAEQIIYHGWNCLSSSSHRHGYAMTQWMLVSHEWLEIVLSIVFRNLWITSRAHIQYIVNMYDHHPSFICRLAGISNVREHLAKTCRSLTVSVYNRYDDQYSQQCTELIGHATIEPCRRLVHSYTQVHAIPLRDLPAVIGAMTPRITALHFVFIDCNATCLDWNARGPLLPMRQTDYPLSLVELHVSFVYTSPPPAVLLDAPRGTFFPPPDDRLPYWYGLYGVKKLIVRDANTDLIAFLTTACPRVETIQSTAEFRAEDVPEVVPADIRAQLVFTRLPRTTVWPGVTGGDAIPRPADWLKQEIEAVARRHRIKTAPSKPSQTAPSSVPVRTGKPSLSDGSIPSQTAASSQDVPVKTGKPFVPPETLMPTRKPSVAPQTTSPVAQLPSKTRKNPVWRIAIRVFQGHKWRL